MGTHLGEIGEMTREYRNLTQGVLRNRLNLIILMVSLIIVFFLKNSFEKNQKLKFNFINNIEIVTYFWFGVFSLIQISEFLYFNF